MRNDPGLLSQLPCLTTLHSAALSAFSARITRIAVWWLIALVLPMQGAAVVVFGAMGPAHVHRSSEAPLLLEDFRRWKPAPVAATHVFAALGHSHADASPQRHHHPAGDASIQRIGSDLDEADEGPGTSAVSVLALIPSSTPWLPPTASVRTVAGPQWALRTAFITPFERPPKPA